jgi:membrane-bound metal-dependent hydrolase YbcI (DUF457 family)
VGNFRQHLKFSSTLGASYASLTWLLIGIDWLYGSIALLFSMLGGMLPDLDSDSGKEIRHLTSITAVFSALLFWAASGQVTPPLAFEVRIWITLFSAWFWSRCLRWLLGRITVHRGMFHSIPTCLIWGSLMYLYYPHENHWVRVYMASGIMVGYMSHLLCDEYFSVESFVGLRVNKAFGTAMKFWSGSLFATMICYVILGLCVKQVTEVWPRQKDGTFVAVGQPSESLDFLKNTASARFQNHVNFVKSHGFLAWVEQLLLSLQTHVQKKVEVVKENGITSDGLKTSIREIRDETKSSVTSSATIKTVSQIAKEAKSTVSEGIQVDSTVHADRPLIKEPALTQPESKVSNITQNLGSSIQSGIDTLEEKSRNQNPTKKPFQMEVYQPRKRTRNPSDLPENVARQPNKGLFQRR